MFEFEFEFEFEVMDHLCILAIMLSVLTVAKKTILLQQQKNTEFEMIDTKISSTAYIVIYELITLLPWRWHILYIPLEASGGISAEACELGIVFSPDNLVSGPYTQFNIYVIEISSFQETGLSTSQYGHRYHVTLCIAQLHPITVYRIGFGVCVVLVLSYLCSFY